MQFDEAGLGEPAGDILDVRVEPAVLMDDDHAGRLVHALRAHPVAAHRAVPVR